MLQSRHACLNQLDDLSKSQSDTPLQIEVANRLLLEFIALVLSDEVIEARKYAEQLQKVLKSRLLGLSFTDLHLVSTILS